VRAKNVGEKNCRKKLRKTFFYIHTNIVTKKWGEKTRETIFSETHEECEKKCLEKIFGKVRKKFFYIHTNIVKKKWGTKRAKQFFRNTLIVRAKNVGKKSSEKSAKNVFLYSH